jgi:Asp-tRNA(Asn)/Glu-tRNA(Gln) amidotransferase A subunit family amidase
MTFEPWTLSHLRSELAAGTTTPCELAEAALARSSTNPSRNTYLWQDAEWTRAEARRISSMPRGEGGPFGDGRSALWGIPVSVKDIFDLTGAPTSCGIRYYRDLNGDAARDSWLVEQLRARGAVIVGKSHLHAAAYGITGENPEFGDCIQPRTTDALTGGSSSGAVASVMEGSAVAGIGTDTGGSVRVPAALSGLAGYRASAGRGDWRGGAHTAETFDTMGWLFRDLEDAPLLCEPFAAREPVSIARFSRFAYVSEEFLHDCEPGIVASFRAAIRELEALGLQGQEIENGWWSDSIAIFAPIQASEAARYHAGYYEHFEPAIRERLQWGASLDAAEVAQLRGRHAEFRARMDELFATHEVVMFPASPVAKLAAGAGHSGVGDATRKRLLRYTTPFSLAGSPAVTIPYSPGGMQLGAARENDEALLELAAQIGRRRKGPQK